MSLSLIDEKNEEKYNDDDDRIRYFDNLVEEQDVDLFMVQF